MVTAGRLQAGLNNMIRKAGKQVKIARYDQTIGSVYDDEVVLTTINQAQVSNPTTFGWAGGALSNTGSSLFLGSPSFATVTNTNLTDQLGQFTMAVWFNGSVVTQDYTNNDVVMATWVQDDAPSLRLMSGTSTGYTIETAANINGSNKQATSTDNLIDNYTGSWFHMASTYNGVQLNLYFNGSLVGSNVAAGSNVPSAGLMRIGVDDADRFCAGSYDDFRLYNTALSSSQIDLLFNGSEINPSKILHYRFDEAAGSVANAEHFYTSGIVLPLDIKSSSFEASLVEQGKLLDQDQRLFVAGNTSFVGSELQVKIGLGSPPTEEYSLIPFGMVAPEVEGQHVYRKAYIRRLPTGSLIGE